MGAFSLVQALILLCVSAVAVYFACANWALRCFLPLASADYYVYFTNSALVVRVLFLLLFAVFLYSALKDDFTPAFVTRCQNRAAIWNCHCIRAVVYAAVYALFLTGCVYAASCRLGTGLIRWNDVNTMYFLEVEMTNPHTTFAEVAAAFFVGQWMLFSGTALAVLLAWWANAHPAAPWFGVIAVVVWDTLLKKANISFLSVWVRFSFTGWHAGQVWPHLLAAALLCAALYLVGRIAICRHKEFYR